MDDSVGQRGWRTAVDAQTGDGQFQNAQTEADGLVHSARANYKGPIVGGVFSANGLVSVGAMKEVALLQRSHRRTLYEPHGQR